MINEIASHAILTKALHKLFFRRTVGGMHALMRIAPQHLRRRAITPCSMAVQIHLPLVRDDCKEREDGSNRGMD